ncbi:hypothetical protein [Rhodococcus tibetensis]|uniref:Uncharacterized protein n=1 Tax=Rhodococcus tibetensis TaxID=2965064 RepID=A0ABT1QHK0_9NOCA|nr:hypothetical protein [Rhodococcus sp. FXJ9.536]MCQ4121657.1 hypothetical protein [Rhodococcus sp. FXJ9.536]
MSAPTEQPPEVLYTNVWSADSGVDLLQRGAELVRATYESADYTRFVGQARSFPGYPEAVGGPARRGDPEKEDFFTSLDPGQDEQIPLTNFLHITAFEETAAGVGATVCTYNLRADPGVNLSVEGLNLAFRIELERTGEDSGQPGIPDTNPAQQDPRAHRPPSWNVFDGWKITKLRYLRPPMGDEMPQGCIDWWLQQLPSFTENASGIVVPPPGFETPTMPVAVQYPEWIGPATPE